MKLLFVAPFTPGGGADHGGGRVMAGLIHALAERHEIVLLCLRAAGEPPTDERLRVRCAAVEEVPAPVGGMGAGERVAFRLRVLARRVRGSPEWVTRTRSARLRHRVAARAARWRPDVVQFEYHVMGQYVDALGRMAVPRVLNQHECGTRAAADRARGAEGARWGVWPELERRAWARYEADLAPRMDAVVVFSREDRAAMEALAPAAALHHIPFGVAVPGGDEEGAGAAPRAEEPGTVLFVGNFRHPPNVEAASRLVERILPLLRARYPGVRLQIVGTHPPPELLAARADDVVVTGHVPAVEPFLERAEVVVAPLDSGGGMRVKVVEAMAAGKPLVASPLALEGVEGDGGAPPCVVARTDDEFADAVAALLRDGPRRAELGEAAERWAREHLGWSVVARRYEDVYASVVEGPLGERARRRPGGAIGGRR